MSDIHEAVGSYLVGALDAEEQVEFAEHLKTCELCRREVAELSETVSELGALTATTPPPSVRSGVLSAIQQVRPLPPLGPDASKPRDESSPVGVPAAPTFPQPDPGAAVDELAVRRARRRSRLLGALAAAAVVLAVALGGWASTLRAEQQALVAAQRAETELLAAPDARVYRVDMANGGQASFVVSRTLDRALFVGGRLPDVGPDRTYQLWTVDGDQQAAAAGLVGSGTGVRQAVQAPVRTAAALAVSIEPAGGSTTPTPNQIQKVVPLA